MDTQRGLTSYAPAPGLVYGLAAADVEGDGDIDLFVPTRDGTPNRLYINDGAGHFEDRASLLGVASNSPARGGLFADFNDDGLLDLVVVQDDYLGNELLDTVIRLYRQGADGVFEDVSVQSGVFGVPHNDPGAHIGGAVIADLDNDSDLDVCVTRWNAESIFMLNDGSGVFSERSGELGLGFGFYWQPVANDLDGDGSTELFIAHDFLPNRLLTHSQDSGFTDLAVIAGVDTSFNEMGVTLGDLDEDGDFEIYVTNIYGTEQGELEHNVLFMNESTPGSFSFVETATALGIENGGGGWGASFFDADNDSDLDLIAVNGIEPVNTAPWRLFLNDQTRVGAPSFRNVERQVGFDRLEYGSCALTFDFDRDGDLDAAVTTSTGRVMLFENRALGRRANNWLCVRPRSAGTNTHAIGAVVRVEIGGRTLSRVITCGTSMMGQEPAEAHFGLGGSGAASRVVVEWPDSVVTTYEQVAPNQILDVTR